MKEFEKWNKENPVDSRYRDVPINQFNAFIEEGREVVWRAALEYVLKGCVLPNGMISYSLIQKELGD